MFKDLNNSESLHFALQKLQMYPITHFKDMKYPHICM